MKVGGITGEQGLGNYLVIDVGVRRECVGWGLGNSCV